MKIAYLIDADWVIHHLNGHATITQRLQDLQAEGRGLSVVALAEVYEGVYYARDPEASERGLNTFLESVTLESGYCDRMRQTISVRVARATSERRITIMHECCHAVTTGSHGPRFLARMRQASDQAERCGEPDIAQGLRQEVAKYEALVGSTALSAGAVSQRFEMIRGEENPTFTCDEVIQCLADEQGSTGPEILTFYPRLPQVYAKTKRRLLRTFRTQLATVRAAHVPAAVLARVEAQLVPLVQALAGVSASSA